MAYDGTEFHGWARQPNSITVQETVEKALSLIYRKPIYILGCGRTDSGVHASCFYFHVDLEDLIKNLIYRINCVLPKSITFYSIHKVSDDAHARFDAKGRSYQYLAHSERSPFLNLYSSYIMQLKNVDVNDLNLVANLLLDYKEFYPFCKTHADSNTYTCSLSLCQWTYDEHSKQFILNVKSDRFLRGMIRLIVGSCVLVATESLRLEDVKVAMDKQERIVKSWSAPPNGLFLNDVQYPYIKDSL